MNDAAKLRIINASQRRELALLREQLDMVDDLTVRMRRVERAIHRIHVYLGAEVTQANRTQ